MENTKLLKSAADSIDKLVEALEQINTMSWREVNDRIEAAREIERKALIAAASSPVALSRYDVIYRPFAGHSKTYTTQVSARNAKEARERVLYWLGENTDIIEVIEL